MPFTFSHPAIILPLLNRRWKVFSATGLLAGSLAPDFESFIGLGAGKEYSHQWLGIFWFDLPIALLLSLVFHAIVKQPLIDNLPSRFAGKFENTVGADWVAYANGHFLIVIASALLGIASHLLWDAFTHLNLFFPDAITSKVMWHGHRVYIILQYSCSLLGLLAIGYYQYRMPVVALPAGNTEKYKFWVYFLMLATVIATFVFTTIAHEEWLLDKVYLINAVIGSLMYALIIVSFIYKYVARRLT